MKKTSKISTMDGINYQTDYVDLKCQMHFTNEWRTEVLLTYLQTFHKLKKNNAKIINMINLQML